jgi:alpha-L-rhamnosidase
VFISSDPMINSIQEMCLNSFRSNFQGLPIDCPHREKNGWTGDAKISVHCGLLNFNMETSYRKWLEDCRDAMRESGELPGIVPSPGWGFAWGNGPCWDIAYPYLAWQLYVYSGNIRILEEHYPSLRRYGEFLHAAKLNARGLVDWGLADWVPPYGTPMEYTAPREFFTSAYAMLCWSTVSKIAAALELQSDRERFAGYAENCRKAIRLHYYSPETCEYASGSQSAQSVALHLGIPEESERERVLQVLAALVARDGGGMNCGILGTEAILHALSDGGGRYHELAWSLAVRREYPSWGYMMEHGATTLWESWQGNSSLNHVLFSDISHWFYRVLAGIRPVEKFPGFKYYLLQPQVAGDLRFVKCKVQIPSGTVKVHWRRNGGDFYLTLIQPEGCTACVILPDGSRHELKTPQGKWHCRIPCEQQHVTVTGVETVLI